MKTRSPFNFKLLYQAIVLGVYVVSGVSVLFYLSYLLLSLLFSSLAGFASCFVIAVTLVVFGLYDAELFQWDNNPRIAIKRFREADDHEE